MAIQYDKPFKTFQEQIDQLKTVHKLQINNDKFAEYALSTFSYYDLVNGYKELFMVNDVFNAGTTIEYLTYFHLYDKDFQNFVFQYSTMIENTFKNKLAYVLAESFGVDIADYLDNRNYKSSYKNKIYLYNVKTDILNHSTKTDKSGNRIYTQQPSKHYADNHNHIPPWILLKNVTFADAISLYKLLKSPEKQKVSHLMLSANIPVNEKIQFLTASLDLIRHWRNVVAHNLKFTTYACPKYNLPVNIAKKIIPEPSVFQGRKQLCDLYGCLVAIYIMLDNPFLALKFLNSFFRVYNNSKASDDTTKQLYAQIRQDYFNITGLGTNLTALIQYACDNIPKESPFI